ncbi:MAG: hypothetical protein OXE40_13190, partial [Gammaproteobacteria bacterium]|nr:hypothetical protein [Gammaproteobacteria bacterium]
MGLDYNPRMAWQKRWKSGVVFVIYSPDSPTRLDTDDMSLEAEWLGGSRHVGLNRTVIFLDRFTPPRIERLCLVVFGLDVM